MCRQIKLEMRLQSELFCVMIHSVTISARWLTQQLLRLTGDLKSIPSEQKIGANICVPYTTTQHQHKQSWQTHTTIHATTPNNESNKTDKTCYN